MDENDVKVVDKFVDLIRDLATDSDLAPRIRMAEVTWRVEKGENNSLNFIPGVRIEFIDGPYAEKVEEKKPDGSS